MIKFVKNLFFCILCFFVTIQCNAMENEDCRKRTIRISLKKESDPSKNNFQDPIKIINNIRESAEELIDILCPKNDSSQMDQLNESLQKATTKYGVKNLLKKIENVKNQRNDMIKLSLKPTDHEKLEEIDFSLIDDFHAALMLYNINTRN